MIDTFTVSYEFPRETAKESFLKLLSYMQAQYKMKMYNKLFNSFHFTGVFCDYGILSFAMLKHEPRKENGYFVKLTINPKALLDQEDYDHISLAVEKDYASVACIFDTYISCLSEEAGVFLPSLDTWVPTRVDFAVNAIGVPASLYVYLFNKGAAPPNAVLKCSLRKCFQYKANGSYYRPYKGLTINFYNKTLQLQQKHNITLNCDVLRLEVQLKLNDKKRIAASLGLDGSSELTLKALWNKILAYDTLYRYIVCTVGKEDFLPKSKTSSILRSKQKGVLLHKAIEFLNILNVNNVYFDIAENIFIVQNDDHAERYFRDRVLPVFRKVGVNPITLPAKSGFKRLPNPLCFLEQLQ